MPERNHEVIIDGFMFPDTVTVTLANDEYINSRDYVSKELYESISDANTAWQTENAKLRELARQMHKAVRELQNAFDASVVIGGVELSAEHFEVELNKLGIEVGA